MCGSEICTSYDLKLELELELEVVMSLKGSAFIAHILLVAVEPPLKL
jgi:hypothetical protein